MYRHARNPIPSYNAAVSHSIRIIYASTSGHTEYVIDVLATYLQGKKKASCIVNSVRAEQASAEDFAKDDVLILASGTWNTGSVEGQLNPHMHELLKKRVADIDLKKKPCAVIALGDDRYYYTARANEHCAAFIKARNGAKLLPPLIIVNEPYGQAEKVTHWGDELLKHLSALPPTDDVE